MASVLDISQASYARSENEGAKVTIDRLYKIAEVLDTNIIDFFNADNVTIQNQNNYEDSYGLTQNLTIENKEIYEKLLKSEDEQIDLLSKIIENYLKGQSTD